MAINFPSTPGDGEEYTDPNSGTWTYDSGTNSWTLTAGGSTSAFNFRGGHDFRSSTPPADPIESGDMWIHDAPNGTIDNVYTGISGQIANGQLVLWDGNSYVMISGTLPGYPDVGDGEGGTLDSRYLKLGANAGAQTVASTGTTTFNGLVEAGNGVSVTGEVNADLININKPVDFWAPTSSYIGFESSNQDIGSVTTSGGFATAIYSNGYRDNTYNWKSLNVNGLAGGGVLELNPNGSLNFRASADTTQYADGVNPGFTRFSIATNTSDDSADAQINAKTTIRGKGISNGTELNVFRAETTLDDNDTTATLVRNISAIATGNNPSVNNVELFRANKGSSYDATNVQSIKGLAIEGMTDAGDNAYGVYSNVGAGTKNNYNFYAAGDAPNYFNGPTAIGSTYHPNLFNGTKGLKLRSGSNSLTNTCIELTGAGTNNLNFAVIKFTKATTWDNDLTQDQGLVDAGFIRIVGTGDEASDQGIQIDYGPSGSLTQTSDYRLKTNISDYQDASQVIKNLKPRTYTWSDSGKTDFGFVAHELQEFVPKAVVGTKDATEAIGTLADYDGTVLETEVTEPEELTYTEDVTDSEGVTTQEVRTRTWTATGTRPVYQGVDQTKLIPLLTKALQEALDRIEVLEAAAGY